MDDFPEFETYADVIDAYEKDNMGYATLTDYIKGENIKIKEIDISPLSDLKNMRDGGPVGIEILFTEKVPAAPSQLVSESDILLGYRGDAAYRSASEQSKSIGQGNVGSKASFGGGKGIDRSGRDEGASGAVVSPKLEARRYKNKMASTTPKGPNIIDKIVDNPLTKLLDPRSKVALAIGGYKLIRDGIPKLKDIAIEDELENITKQGGIVPYADGGRVGLFMGGPALEGTALNIYNSMNAYGFSDQEIANALQERGLYTPGGSTPDTPSDNIIGAQLDQGGGGGGTGIMELQETFTRAPGSKPKFSEDAFFGLGKFFQGKERGTLGNRLQKQFELGQKLPSPLAKIAGTQSPFNPDSKNYNPDFIDQLNFLELGDDMIGMSSTGLKYGEGSVLRGQNVISGFGSNNYLAQLNKYINRKNITDKARQRGIDERDAFLAAQEEKKKAEELAAAAEIKRRQEIATTPGRETGSGGREVATDAGSVAGAQQDISNYQSFGEVPMARGGLATMFRNKR